MSTAQGERRLMLASTRHILQKIPVTELFEIPGRPHVVYQLKDYSSGTEYEASAALARQDAPFLFKAFETGQIGPKRLSKMSGDKPRVATIHEYLEWTVTSQSAEADDELDFSGFRVLVILQRFVPGWPPPGQLSEEGNKGCTFLGAQFQPLPSLQSHSKPVCAATIRAGPGYLEVPFVATSESKRGRGYCRCLLEALEDVARGLDLPLLMLCSTNDPVIKATWRHLGFLSTSEEDMAAWDIAETDLVYLQNTKQMHKFVGAPPQHKALVIKQGNFRQRIYVRLGSEGKPVQGGKGAVAAAAAAAAPSSSSPAVSPARSERAEDGSGGGGGGGGGRSVGKGTVAKKGVAVAKKAVAKAQPQSQRPQQQPQNFQNREAGTIRRSDGHAAAGNGIGNGSASRAAAAAATSVVKRPKVEGQSFPRQPARVGEDDEGERNTSRGTQRFVGRRQGGGAGGGLPSSPPPRAAAMRIPCNAGRGDNG